MAGRILTELEDILTTVTGLEGRIDTLENIGTADRLVTGESTYARSMATAATVTQATQVLRLSYFTAFKTESAANCRVICGGTAAGATPTLVRFGLYTIAANGDGTLVASTPNDTTLLAVASTAYTKAFSAPYAKVAGTRLAVATLVVTAATAPTLVGLSATLASEMLMAPTLSGVIGGQADLPASFTAASVVGTSFRTYAVLTP